MASQTYVFITTQNKKSNLKAVDNNLILLIYIPTFGFKNVYCFKVRYQTQ